MDEIRAATLWLLSKRVRFERKLAKMAESHASRMDADFHAAEAALHRAEAALSAERSHAARSYAQGIAAAMDGVRLPVLVAGDKVEVRVGQTLLSGTVVRHGVKLGIEVADECARS